jgi:hypothetical protein
MGGGASEAVREVTTYVTPPGVTPNSSTVTSSSVRGSVSERRSPPARSCSASSRPPPRRVNQIATRARVAASTPSHTAEPWSERSGATTR